LPKAKEPIMVVSAPTYTELALSEAGHQLELHDGVLVEKPPMTIGHNWSLDRLSAFFYQQLDLSRFGVRVNSTRLYLPDNTYFIPDLAIIPVAAFEALGDRKDVLEVYASPLPLVVEIWSPSTGDYDVNEKIPRYRERGDLEIWRIHPFERTITAWRRQPDGGYLETVYSAGSIEPIAVPPIRFEIEALFD
jgi:Uma2 family endonuclease